MGTTPMPRSTTKNTPTSLTVNVSNSECIVYKEYFAYVYCQSGIMYGIVARSSCVASHSYHTFSLHDISVTGKLYTAPCIGTVDTFFAPLRVQETLAQKQAGLKAAQDQLAEVVAKVCSA